MTFLSTSRVGALLVLQYYYNKIFFYVIFILLLQAFWLDREKEGRGVEYGLEANPGQAPSVTLKACH